MKKSKQFLALVLSLATVSSLLTGCAGGSDLTEEMYRNKVDVSKTVTKKSKWINSDFVGAVTEDTDVSLKDDFYTAANKDWFLNVQDRVAKESSVGELMDNIGVIIKQELDMMNQAEEGSLGDNHIGMDTATYDHLKEIYSDFIQLAANWEERNEEGTKPLEAYLNQIENIESIDELSSYLINADGSFISGSYPIGFSVEEGWKDENEDTNTDNKYTVMIRSDYETCENSPTSVSDYEYRENLRESMFAILSDYGYSQKEVNKILKNAWKYEELLKENSSYDAIDSSKIENSLYFNNLYSKEDLEELAGNYPLMEILSTYNYDGSKEYTVWEPDYVKAVGKLYTEKNLEIMKDYYLVHTVINNMKYLSKDCYDAYENCFETEDENYANLLMGGSDDSKDTEESTDSKKDSDSDSDNKDGDSTDAKTQEILSGEDLTEEETILFTTVTGSLKELNQEMYVANYCTSEQKEYLENLLSDIVDSYKEILSEEDWISEKTKKKAIDKLEKMSFRVLYPDTMNDYEGLNLTGLNLMQSVAAVKNYNLKKEAEKINEKVDKTDWDLSNDMMTTTTTNAYYMPSDNSATIMAGIVAADNYFSLDASYEENLSHIGVIMGHEISHAFDSSGYMFDVNGDMKQWWTTKDVEAFQKKIDKVAKYFSTYTIYRDGDYIDGSKVEAEATADMGGMRCALNLASRQENFDYEKFFLSYAKTFATCQKFTTEIAMAKDEHPVSYLRCNIVVQQFDEFYDTFDIKEGDGMYLAPEKRVAVW